jgi:hypothetical protein
MYLFNTLSTSWWGLNSESRNEAAAKVLNNGQWRRLWVVPVPPASAHQDGASSGVHALFVGAGSAIGRCLAVTSFRFLPSGSPELSAMGKSGLQWNPAEAVA